jgi:sigma-E factor negative regulatory protein RseA
MPLDHSQDTRRAALSALMDGRSDAADDACRAWRSDEAARADWHAYHLIGDVLRSDEYRADAAHDAHFMARLRDRLAAEPAVLAPPSPGPVRLRRKTPWMAPAAVAAGFVVVAGVLVVTRMSVPGGDAGDRSALVAADGVRAVSTQAASASAVPTPDNATMIRSAELDRYLEAHRQAATGSALVAPGGVVRSATVAAPGR